MTNLNIYINKIIRHNKYGKKLKIKTTAIQKSQLAHLLGERYSYIVRVIKHYKF